MKSLIISAILLTQSLLVAAPIPDIEASKDRNQTIDQRENYFQTSTPHKITPKVNPITGDLIEEEADLVVAGCEPLSVRRFYSHTATYEPKTGGWRYNPEAFFVANFEWPGQETFAAAGDSDGSIASFKPSTSDTCTFSCPKGFSNFNPTGQTHPLNTKINYHKAPDKKKGYFSWIGEIVDGSGTKRLFDSGKHCWLSELVTDVRRKGRDLYVTLYTPNVWTPYQLPISEEKRPNGTIICYSYGSWKKCEYFPRPPLLTGIEVYNADKSKKIGAITFHYNPDKHGDIRGIKVVGSDAREAVIHHQGSSPILLHSVQTPDKPNVTYGYQKGWVNRVEKPEGRVTTTEYDPTGKVASQSAPVGPNGEMYPIGRYVYHDTDTEVYDAEGHKTIYRFNEHKQILSIETYKDGNIYRIDRLSWDTASGNLLKKTIEDSSGKPFQITEYRYDSNQNPIEEKIGDGNHWHTIQRTFSKDGFNLKLSESDREGKEIQYQYKPGTNLLIAELVYDHGKICKRTIFDYDDCACLIKAISDDGTSPDPQDLMKVTFRKITENKPKQETPCFGLPETILEKTIDSSGQEILLSKVVYAYTPFGKVLKEDHYDATGAYRYTILNDYDDRERLISTVDPVGNTTHFSYDLNNNLIAITGPKQDQYKEITYDKANRPTLIADWQTDGSVLTIEKRYDKLGQVIAEIDACGNATQFQYDALGRITAIQHPDGAVERKEYDILGNVIKEIDAEGYETRTLYDFRGKPLSIYYPDGKEEHFTYNSTGTIATHTDKNDSKSIYEYDIFENPVRTTVYSQSGQLLKTSTSTYTPFCKLSETDGEGTTTFYTYDFCGRKTAEQTATQKTHYFYDALGRMTESDTGYFKTTEEHNHANKPISKRIQGPSGNIQFQEEYTYDEAGNRTHIITSQGQFETLYNTYGKPLSEKDPLGFSKNHEYCFNKEYIQTTTDANGILNIRIYDTRGREAEVLKKNKQGEIIAKHTNRYNKNGNLIACTYSIYSGPQLIKTITHNWEYGPTGRIERFVEAGEKETCYLYDTKGRLQAIIKPSGTQLQHEWDDLGRLARYFSSDFDYRYTYDRNDRILAVYDAVSKRKTTRSYNTLGHMTQEILGSGAQMDNIYDDHGRRSTLTLPDGSTIDYSYNGAYLYAVHRKGLSFSYKIRDLEGYLIEAELPQKLGNIYLKRDPLSRWKEFETPFYQFLKGTYDPVGNLIHYQYQDSLGKVDCAYQYDDLNQLISENEHTYLCDSLYNRLKKDDASHQVNNLNQITDDGHTGYEYDLDGNLIFDGKWHYKYDTQDRLIAVDNGKTKVEYTYDAFHRRLSKKTFSNGKPIKHERYLWDGDHEIGTVDEKGNIEQLRILGEGLGAEIGAAILYELQGKTYVPIHDHRGCLVTLIDPATQKPVESYRYTSFGEELTNNKLSPWRFSSKRIEQETGLIFFGRRYYFPTLGRWITQDPQGFDDGPNLYAYLSNCPLTDCDLYGLWSMREAWGNAQNFMWGMFEGSAYHFSNIASSFCMRDLSSPGWQPQSFMSSQGLSNRGLDFAEKTFLPFTYEAKRLENNVSQHDLMRARGRAFGEQAITFGGLFSAMGVGKGLLNAGTRFQEMARFPVQELSRQYLFSGKPNIIESSQSLKGTRNRFKPDTLAEGAHSVFRRDPVTGRVTHYETFRQQINPYDPKPWESVSRFDNPFEPHYHFNKVLKERIYTPHVHDPYHPGGIRRAKPWEIPWESL